MAKRQKTTRFSVQGFDMAHYRQTEEYTLAVNALFDAATTDIAREAARGNINPDKPFSFDDYPSVKKVMQDTTNQLASRMTTVIETGSKKQWLYACDKNDAFIESIFDTTKLTKAQLKKMQDRNLEALQSFQQRKVQGLSLSQRVWKYVGQYKEQMETALDVGLGEGRSAQQLARDVKQNLVEPDRLFRRVRDKRGNLVLSKAAQAYHPGRGVYRSSVKNAQRLTRSEINMAYRESDYQRWQMLDFVVGYEIMRSNHDPLCKCPMCEQLVGRYPKWFIFRGWHPQCMCFAVPILMDEETYDENELGDLKAALRGTTYKKHEAKNTVTDVPDGFKQWVQDHIEAQKGWSSTPYFIRDNFKNGLLSDGLLRPIEVRPISTLKPQTMVEVFKGSTPQEIQDFILQHIAETCTLEIKKGDIDLWNDIVNQLNTRIAQFGLPKFGNLGKPASRKAEASWDEFGNNLNLNITALRNRKGVKVEETWAKKGILYSFANKDAADYVRAIIDHEIGHAVWAKYGGALKKDLLETFSKAAKSVIVDGKPFVEVNDILGYYASTDELEYFAEAFSFYMGKNRAQLGTETKAFIERFLKKSGAKIDAQTGKTPKVDPVQQQIDALQPQITQVRKICSQWGLNTFVLDDAIAKRNPTEITNAITTLKNRAQTEYNEILAYFLEAKKIISEATQLKVDCTDVNNDMKVIMTDYREWVMGKTVVRQRLAALKAKIEQAKQTMSGIHPAMKVDYQTLADVEETFKAINAEFKTEKWFEHGDLQLGDNAGRGCNGDTNMKGRIRLTPTRCKCVKSALAKIGQGKAKEITFEEADAMATFWHEITHNRNVPGNMYTTTKQTSYMELANEFVARHSLSEFYGKMGVKDLPFPEFQKTRKSTGYNAMVTNYDYVIDILKLDRSKVYSTVRKHLFTEKYDTQVEGLKQGLIDGGIHYLTKDKFGKYKSLSKSDLNKLVSMIESTRWGAKEQAIETWLKEHDILQK